MKFIENVDKEEYENFVKNSPKSHFLQSYAWGEFAKKEKHLIPFYVGLKDDNNNLQATALLLQKKLPMSYCYFYAPRGFVLDYSNKELLKEFTLKIKDFCKKNKAIFFKIDPDLIYKSTNTFGEVIKDNDDSVVEMIKSIGFKHLGFTKNFETMQPRYSFRIDMNKQLDDIKNNFSKTTIKRIEKADEMFCTVKIGNKEDIHTFYELMIITENRKDFITHNEDYYNSLYDIWNKDNKCYLFIGGTNLDKIIKNTENIQTDIMNELKLLDKDELSKKENTRKKELEKNLEKINKDLSRYVDIRTEYNTDIILSGHFIITYGDKAWVLYAGNHNILTDTYANYKTYYEHIKFCHDNGIKMYDQFGTIGDLREDNPLIGLHEFKRKFGGDYVEFTGEFDYIINKPMYFIFTKLVPLYRNIVKKISKLKRKKKGE